MHGLAGSGGLGRGGAGIFILLPKGVNYGFGSYFGVFLTIKNLI